MKDKKKIVIGTLCALIMIMAVGYALLSQQLSINGSAAITSNWQVEITNITEKEKSTGATTNSTNYTATTASFNTSLTSPGDYALYEVTVTNSGTLDAVLSAKPTVTTGNNEAIIYELEGIARGDKILKNNGTDTFTIKVQYNPNVTSQPANLTSNIEVTLNYEQDLGQIQVLKDTYDIGDKIKFAGSDWYVIKASTMDEDYLTLMKEKVITHAEFGQNYALTYICKKGEGTYGCDPETDWEYFNLNSMGYYWSSNCHAKHKYGTDEYNTLEKSGCAGHNTYEGSKVKEFLEGTYINTLDASKLKEVDGYKIRLITLDELRNDLGWTNGTSATDSGNNVPSWVYENIDGQHSVFGYYTMTPMSGNSSRIWSIHRYGILHNSMDFIEITFGVRPVINLLKSAIE